MPIVNKFNSLEELYNRLIPAMEAKVNELKLKGEHNKNNVKVVISILNILSLSSLEISILETVEIHTPRNSCGSSFEYAALTG